MTEEEIKDYEANGDPENGLELTKVKWRKEGNPGKHWAVPIVSGHKFLLRWEFGLDFEKMRFEIVPDLWDSEEFELEMPFYDVRESITVDGNDGVRKENNTLGEFDADLGSNLVRNDTDLMLMPDLGKRMNMLINGKNKDRTYIDLEGWRCVGTDWNGECDVGDVDTPEPPSEYRRWSDIASWPELGRLPIDDDDIVIDPSWNMLYDLPADGVVPKLKSLQINGYLTFEDGADRLLMSHSIWVRTGVLNIGNETHPF